MNKYLYQAVCGAGLWGKPRSIFAAKKTVLQLRQGEWKAAEVERVLLVPPYGQRYWRWRDGRWSKKFWTEPTREDLSRWS